MSNTYDYMFKLLLMGDSGSGKSAILARYIDNIFLDKFNISQGVELKIKNLRCNDKIIKLQIWDIPGLCEHRYRLNVSYYRNCNGIFIIFDVNDPNSFQNIAKFIEEVKHYTDIYPILILLGNKTDLDESRRKVTYNEAKELADNFGMEYFEISAKDNINIEKVFEEMCSKLIPSSEIEITI